MTVAENGTVFVASFTRSVAGAGGVPLHVSVWDGRSETTETDLPAFIFLHYFGGSGLEWEAVASALAGMGTRCFAPDARGHGGSGAPDSPAAYSVDTMADDALMVVGAAGLSTAPGGYVLVGHSMGGKAAFAAAARQPAGLRGLILVSPSPPTPEPIPDADRAHLLATQGQRQAAEETADKIVGRPLTTTDRAGVIADNLRTSPVAWRAWFERGTREDLSARTPQITIPVLIVLGGSDTNIPRAVVERDLTNRLSSAEQTILPGVGHLSPLEAAPELVACFQSWLSRLP